MDEVDLRLEDVSVSFEEGQITLCDMRLDCRAGEFVAIVGPSGCGKSTLLRVVAGLLAPSQGRVVIGSGDTIGPRDLTARISFVFQEPALLPWRNVSDNISLPLRLRGNGRKESLSMAERAARQVGLRKEDFGKLPRMLSGGMRMRVSLARALVTSPHVMLMDEPLAAVDDILREQLLGEVAKLWLAQRWTVLFVTHNVGEAVFMSQRVLVMAAHPGRFVAEFAVPFDYPRAAELRDTAEFAAMTGRVRKALRDAVT